MTDQIQNPKKRPHTLRDGPLKATIWENERSNGKDYSVNFSRSYQNKEGQWVETKSFSQQHLSQLKSLCERSFSHIEEKKQTQAYVRQQKQLIHDHGDQKQEHGPTR